MRLEALHLLASLLSAGVGVELGIVCCHVCPAASTSLCLQISAAVHLILTIEKLSLGTSTGSPSPPPSEGSQAALVLTSPGPYNTACSPWCPLVS